MTKAAASGWLRSVFGPCVKARMIVRYEDPLGVPFKPPDVTDFLKKTANGCVLCPKSSVDQLARQGGS